MPSSCRTWRRRTSSRHWKRIDGLCCADCPSISLACPQRRRRRRRSSRTGSFRSEEHTSELQSLRHLVCRLLLEKKKTTTKMKRETFTTRTTKRSSVMGSDPARHVAASITDHSLQRSRRRQPEAAQLTLAELDHR